MCGHLSGSGYTPTTTGGTTTATPPTVGAALTTTFGQGSTVIPAGAKEVRIQHRQNTALVPGDFTTSATVNGTPIDSQQTLVYREEIDLVTNEIRPLPAFNIVDGGDAIWWQYSM